MSTVEITEKNFESLVSAQRIVLLDWWAAWCGPCRAFAPIFENVSKRHPDITFGKIDTEAQPGLANAFKIRSIPTLMLFRDGVLLFAQPGLVPAAALEDLIAQARALDMNEVRREIAAKEARPATTSAATR